MLVISSGSYRETLAKDFSPAQLSLLLHLRGDDFLNESQLSEHFHLLLPPLRDLMRMRLAAQVRATNGLMRLCRCQAGDARITPCIRRISIADT